MGAIGKLQESKFLLTALKGTLAPKAIARAGNEAYPNVVADLSRERKDLLEMLSVTRIGSRIKGDARSEVTQGADELANSLNSLKMYGLADTSQSTEAITRSIAHLDEAMKVIAARRVKTAIATLVVGGAGTVVADAAT